MERIKACCRWLVNFFRSLRPAEKAETSLSLEDEAIPEEEKRIPLRLIILLILAALTIGLWVWNSHETKVEEARVAAARVQRAQMAKEREAQARAQQEAARKEAEAAAEKIRKDEAKKTALAAAIKTGIVRKGRGIEHSLIKAFRADPETFGFRGDMKNKASVRKWAERFAHQVSIEAGYVEFENGKETGREVWVKYPDRVSYVPEMWGPTLNIHEYFLKDGKWELVETKEIVAYVPEDTPSKVVIVMTDKYKLETIQPYEMVHKYESVPDWQEESQIGTSIKVTHYDSSSISPSTVGLTSVQPVGLLRFPLDPKPILSEVAV